MADRPFGITPDWVFELTGIRRRATQWRAAVHVMEIMPDHVLLSVETLPTCPPARLARWLKGD